MPFFNNNFYNEKSVLTAKSVVKWKRKMGAYNFKSLPATVILTPTTNYVRGFKKFSYKKFKGLSGKNYRLNNNFLLSFGYGNGAPAIISQMEELRALGVEKFIFIGFAGMLNNQLNEGSSYLVSQTFSISGTSFYYSNQEKLSYPNPLYTNLKKKLNLLEINCLSVDSPYRETKSVLESFIKKNVSLVEMETASIMAFSKFYNQDCICILVASDSITDFKWIPPKNFTKLVTEIDYIINKILK